MKKVFTAIFVSIGLAIVLPSCQKAPELTLTGPASLEISADGGSNSITFTANRDWSVRCSDSWVSVSPSSGTASDEAITISIRCDRNLTYDDRTATVTIQAEELSQSVAVMQPRNLGIVIPTKTFNIKANTTSIEVEVRANVDYTVSVNTDWVKQNETKALSSNKLSFSIAENTTYDARSATITIKPQNTIVPEQIISVEQTGIEGILAVDLGLSVKWASVNLGAAKPWEYGNYYAWGETVPKDKDHFSDYKWKTDRKWGDGQFSFFKYIPADKPDYWDGEGDPDNKTQLDLEDDAAHVLLGEKWRLPTFAEQEELRKQCDWTWTSWNGINGYFVTSNTNHNSIFIPAGGSIYEYAPGLGSMPLTGSSGLYWSSSLYLSYPDMAHCCMFDVINEKEFYRLYYLRIIGASIRPVTE